MPYKWVYDRTKRTFSPKWEGPTPENPDGTAKEVGMPLAPTKEEQDAAIREACLTKGGIWLP